MPRTKSVENATVKLPAEIAAVTGWDRICLVDPRTLGDNPRNWKVHPRNQLDAVMAAIKRVKWVNIPVYNETTRHLIDGHGRKAEAVRQGICPIPVAIGRWSEEDENFILQSLDTVGSMYRVDADRLKSLTALVKEQTQKVADLGSQNLTALHKLHTGVERLADHIKAGRKDAVPISISALSSRKKPSPDEPPDDLTDDSDDVVVSETTALDDVLFPSENAWDLPALKSDLLLTPDQVPDRTYDRSVESVTATSWYCLTAQRWKERDDTGIMGGVLGTFCEDYHFEGFYDSAGSYIEDLKNFDFTAYTVPDFSTYTSWPWPMRLWNLYRSRWVGRYWQEHGLRILPSLQSVVFPNADSGSAGPYDLALETLAACQPPVVACQCRTLKQNGGDFEEFGKWLTECVRFLRPEAVVIYGGEHRTKFEGYLPATVRVGRSSRKVHYSYLHSYMDRRRVRIKKERT